MAQAQIWQHIRIGDERVREQEAQGRGLNWAAQVKRTALECLGKISDNHVTCIATGTAVQYQTECSLGIVLANQNHRSLKKRALQLTAIEQQLPFQKLTRLRHTLSGTS